MNVVLLPEAENDLREATEWLGEHSEELPSRFKDAVSHTLASIAEHPEMYPVIRKTVRRALLSTFPMVFFMLAMVRKWNHRSRSSCP